MSDELWVPEPRRARVPAHAVGRSTAVRGSDPETSRSAATDTGMVRQAQRTRLLEAFQKAGRAGLTDEEAAREVGLWNTRSCWWKRCTDLRADGRIEFTRHTRMGVMGRQRKVSVVVERDPQ